MKKLKKNSNSTANVKYIAEFIPWDHKHWHLAFILQSKILSEGRVFDLSSSKYCNLRKLMNKNLAVTALCVSTL